MRKLTKKQKIWAIISISSLVLLIISVILNLSIAITVNDPNYAGYIYGIEMSIEQADYFTKFLDITSAIFLGFAFLCTMLSID